MNGPTIEYLTQINRVGDQAAYDLTVTPGGEVSVVVLGTQGITLCKLSASGEAQ